MNAQRVDTTTVRAQRAPLRRPLATARPGLDYLRAAFVAQWEALGATGAGELALAYLQAAEGTPEVGSDVAAVARWAARLQLRSTRPLVSAC